MARWQSFQIVLDNQDAPMRPSASALVRQAISPQKPPSSRENKAAESNLCGGASGERTAARAARAADWTSVANRVHTVGACPECEAKWPVRCLAHSPPARKDQPSYWWHAPSADPGIDWTSSAARSSAAAKPAAPTAPSSSTKWGTAGELAGAATTRPSTCGGHKWALS